MLVGVWRSLVAHLHGAQEVAGSNPVAPTIFSATKQSVLPNALAELFVIKLNRRISKRASCRSVVAISPK